MQNYLTLCEVLPKFIKFHTTSASQPLLILNSFCSTVEQKELVLQEIKEEIDRRKKIETDSILRKSIILKFYKPVIADIFVLKNEMFEESFLKLVETSKCGTIEDIVPLLDVISKEKQLYGFQIFQKWFCKEFIKELEHFEKSNFPKMRPNTMNKYGVLLDELGVQKCFSDILRKDYLESIAKILFPEQCGSELDSHKIFTVNYKVGQDVDLDLHYDNAEVTLNVCLGQNFSKGELYMGDMNSVPLCDSTFVAIPHMVGYGILHRGQQMHGALPVTEGERTNLIMWLRSSSVRNSFCPMCGSVPVLVPSTDYGDGFTKPSNSSLLHLCAVS